MLAAVAPTQTEQERWSSDGYRKKRKLIEPDLLRDLIDRQSRAA
jgi:hypothetical protein